jgi:hypothetical protein
MSRPRAAWLAVTAALLLVAGYVVLHRRRAPQPVQPVPAVPDTVVRAATPAPVAPEPLPLTAQPQPTAVPAAAEVAEVAEPAPPPVVDDATESEAPLPAWARAAIITAALLAFFAVSLIATKHY